MIKLKIINNRIERNKCDICDKMHNDLVELTSSNFSDTEFIMGKRCIKNLIFSLTNFLSAQKALENLKKPEV